MANSKTQLILCVLVAIWCVYSLVAPGEAMSKAVVIMNTLRCSVRCWARSAPACRWPKANNSRNCRGQNSTQTCERCGPKSGILAGFNANPEIVVVRFSQPDDEGPEVIEHKIRVGAPDDQDQVMFSGRDPHDFRQK